MRYRRHYNYRGRWLALEELAAIANVKAGTLYNRMTVSGLSVEEAVTLPFRGVNHPGKVARKHEFREEKKTCAEIAACTGRSLYWVRQNIGDIEHALARRPKYTFAGKTLTLTEWAKETGIIRSTLAMRLANGWSIERALTEPVHPSWERNR